MKLLELFAGSCAVSKTFAARGWTGTCVDIKQTICPPNGFLALSNTNVLELCAADLSSFDFIWASSPCEEFAVWGMRHFHPNPPYPALGVKLFNETREICELSGRPYVMENVRAAQKFVGNAVNHAGSFYLWGNAVPPMLPRVTKGFKHTEMFAHDRTNRSIASATIPTELSKCIAEYAERILEGTMTGRVWWGHDRQIHPGWEFKP